MDEEKIKNIVTQGYRDILKRDPDSGGLLHYTDSIKRGLSEEKFYYILRTSEEYKHITGSQHCKTEYPKSLNIPLKEPSNTRTQHFSDNITYCMIGTNRLNEIRPYIESTLPYIDRFIFIDGGSTDDTIKYLESLNPKYGNKIEVYIHKWQDKFSGQRNNYLKHFAEKQSEGWILVSDTDEHFTIDTLSKLRDIAVSSEEYNGIGFQVEDIITDIDDQDKIVFQKINPYWKNLLFKYHPSIRYEGEPHECLVGHHIRWKQVNLIYQHKRSQRKIYERSVENFFISNSNRYSPKWSEFRSLCTKYGISTFENFFKLYKEGTLNVEIENWIYNHRNDKDDSGDSEVREMSKLYYEILHPGKR